jgi:Flp pilus assembly pilin Flp
MVLLASLLEEPHGSGSSSLQKRLHRVNGYPMKFDFWKLYIKIKKLTHREEGQDLIEYALLVGQIALLAILSMQTVASSVSGIFNKVGSILSTYTG